MTDYHLIVSDPPHPDSDPAAAATYLDCAAAEVRMKLNFPAPDILLAVANEDEARECTKGLLGAGVRVAWVPGSVLGAVPAAQPASAITLDAQSMRITTGSGDVRANAGDRVVVVLGELPQQEARGVPSRGSVLTQKLPRKGPVSSMPFIGGVAQAAGMAGLDRVAQEAKDSAEKRVGDIRGAEPTGPFLDVYAYVDGGWQATRITSTGFDFSGLRDRKTPTARGNIKVIIDVLRTSFDARVDERLVKVTYKPSIVSGMALHEVLKSISATLEATSLMDIGSRLAFLTAKGR